MSNGHLKSLTTSCSDSSKKSNLLFDCALRNVALLSICTDSKSKYIFSLFGDNYLAIFDFASCTIESPIVLQLVKLPLMPRQIHCFNQSKTIIGVNASNSLTLIQAQRPKQLFLLRCFQNKKIENVFVEEENKRVLVFGESGIAEIYQIPEKLFVQQNEGNEKDLWKEMLKDQCQKEKVLNSKIEKKSVRTFQDVKKKVLGDINFVMGKIRKKPSENVNMETEEKEMN